MIRCTIELVPQGVEDLKKVIGLIEICNDGTGNDSVGNYVVKLLKTPPFSGSLKKTWRDGVFEDEQTVQNVVEGHPRYSRGVYDLLYRGLKACGLESRIPK